MSGKIWKKTTDVDKRVDQFTVGQDRELDLFLATHDVLGSMAHIRMLTSIGLLQQEELELLLEELKNIYHEVNSEEFFIEAEAEDIHSQIELMLTRRLGDVGKKIHSGRSRNDQVLLDLKLYTRSELMEVVRAVDQLIETLIKQSNRYRHVLLPGYTHLQVAMPSSFGLWFGAYAESLADDLQLLLSAWKITNRNPLGSAAGYGSSFPLNRQMTTELLGFEQLNYNVVYAQMGRGKTERILAQAMSSIAATLAKMSMDITLYMNQNFAFVKFPDHLTTGSSIMPHKKNPDVLELIRSRCNKIQALPNEIAMMTTNLPSGYFKDLQLLKENLFPAFESLNDCMQLLVLMLDHIQINEEILNDPKYDYLFSVEVVNNEVLSGVPFREAYKNIGLAIENGTYKPLKEVNHTHEGSIGNLMNKEISEAFEKVIQDFNFEKVHQALHALLQE